MERRHHSFRRYGLVFVRHKCRKLVVVNGDSLVRVFYDNGELHGGGHERREGGVEVVDGGADHREPGLVGAVDEPNNEDCGPGKKEEDGDAYTD